MKKLFISLLVLPQMALAHICQNLSPLAKQYQQQKTWDSIVIESSETPVELNALVNEKGVGILDENLFKGDIKSQLVLNLNKKTRRYFKLYCQKGADGDALSSLRKLKKNNSYKIQVKYLPDVEGSLYKKLKTTSYEVRIEYGAHSIIARNPDASELKEEIHQHIMDELESGQELDRYSIDLKNWDDFVCDLAMGEAKLSILRKMVNPKALVAKDENFPMEELRKLYSQWKNSMNNKAQGMQAAFVAGMGYEKLYQENEISKMGPRQAFDAFQETLDPVQSEFTYFNKKQMACFEDSVVDYRISDTRQLINLGLVFDASDILGGLK